MKKAKFNFEDMDLSRYHILTYDELLKVNGGSGSDSDDSDDETVESESEETSDEGAETATESTPSEEGVGEPSADPTSESTSSGTSASNSGDEEESGGHEIENTVEAVANAEVGDTLTRDDGTQVTISQGDIDWAQEHCDSYGKNGEEEKEESPAKESDLPSAEEAGNSDSGATSSENENNNANTNSATNNTTEEKAEQGTTNSAKESEHTAESGTAQSESNKTSSNESSMPISSGHSEKSGHGFFDGIVGWFDEKINTAKDWLSDFFATNFGTNGRYTSPNDRAEVYFIYTYKNTEYDQRMKAYERNSINDDVSWLKEQGTSVKVIEFGTKQDILNAIADNNAKIIITSGHGFSCNRGVQTSDNKSFTPNDLSTTVIGKTLNTVIFENCFQGDLEKEWEEAFGNGVDVVGWHGETSWMETVSFNGIGVFDRQSLDLRDYLEQSIEKGSFDAISGAAPKN